MNKQKLCTIIHEGGFGVCEECAHFIPDEKESDKGSCYFKIEGVFAYDIGCDHFIRKEDDDDYMSDYEYHPSFVYIGHSNSESNQDCDLKKDVEQDDEQDDQLDDKKNKKKDNRYNK